MQYAVCSAAGRRVGLGGGGGSNWARLGVDLGWNWGATWLWGKTGVELGCDLGQPWVDLGAIWVALGLSWGRLAKPNNKCLKLLPNKNNMPHKTHPGPGGVIRFPQTYSFCIAVVREGVVYGEPY